MGLWSPTTQVMWKLWFQNLSTTLRVLDVLFQSPPSSPSLDDGTTLGPYWKRVNSEHTPAGRPARACVSTFAKRMVGDVNLATELATGDDPLTYKAAIKSRHANEWQQAMKAEYNMLVQMNTWELAPKPKDRKIVGGKWIFKTKRNSDGSVKKFKARFVARGFSQVHGIDFNETYSPVAQRSTLRMFLAVIAMFGWNVEQSDVGNAYLNSDITEGNDNIEAIYVEQPEGMEQRGPNGQTLVCKIKKGLYGLKQAARLWNIRVTKWMVKYGFTQSKADPCLFVLYRNNGWLILILYVDDMAYGGDEELVRHFKTAIEQEFVMTHEGPLTWLLGMKVHRPNPKTIGLSQELFVQDVMETFRMQDCKPMSTPAQEGSLSSSQGPVTDAEKQEMASVPMRNLVGSINYLAMCTRPDIQQAVSRVARFVSNPGQAHWTAGLHVLKYLKGTYNMKVMFGETEGRDGNILLTGYCDSDYAGNLDDRKSTSGYMFMMNNGPVSWASRLQRVTATSTVEAEYVALCEAVKEACYLRQVLFDMGFKQADPTVIHVDNAGSIQLAQNAGYHSRTKHMDVRFHYIREKIQDKTVRLKYIPTEDNTADILTKPLECNKFCKHRTTFMTA